MALNVGLPSFDGEKPKKAVQYSTGINDAVKRIAKNHEKTVNEYITELFLAIQKQHLKLKLFFLKTSFFKN